MAMGMNVWVRLAYQHARATVVGLVLLAAVVLVSSLPPMLGLQVAGSLRAAVEQQVDQTDARRVVIEPRGLQAEPMVDAELLEALRGLPGVSFAEALVEIGVKIETADNPEGRMTIAEGTSPGDPRFVPERMVAGEAIGSESAGEFVAVVSRGLAGVLADSTRATIRVIRKRGDVTEELPIELNVVGVSAMEGDRIYVPIGVACALDAWAAWAETLDVNAAGSAQSRAILFASDLAAVGALVDSLEHAGWSTRHRLRDVRSLERTQNMIFAVAAASCTGFALAGLIGTGVYVAVSARAHRRIAAGLRLCGVKKGDGLLMVVTPAVVITVAAFVAAVALGRWAGPAVSQLAAIGLGLPARLDARTSPGGLLLVAAITVVPLVVGLTVTFVKSWARNAIASLRASS